MLYTLSLDLVICSLYVSSQNFEKRLLASSCLSTCLSVRLSVHPHETPRLPLVGFSWNLIFEYFWKICRDNSSFIKIWQEPTCALHKDVCTFMKISRWIFLIMRNVSNRSCRENKNTHFMLRNFVPKIVPFLR